TTGWRVLRTALLYEAKLMARVVAKPVDPAALARPDAPARAAESAAFCSWPFAAITIDMSTASTANGKSVMSASVTMIMAAPSSRRHAAHAVRIRRDIVGIVRIVRLLLQRVGLGQLHLRALRLRVRDARRHDEDELGLGLLVGAADEEMLDDGEVSQDRH